MRPARVSSLSASRASVLTMKPTDCQYSSCRAMCGATSLKRMDSTSAMGEFTASTIPFEMPW